MALVLLIDDDDLLISALRGVLELEGFNILTANEGPKGLTIIRERSDIDVVICDIRMSPMNGIEVLREAKKIRPNLPVIMLTAFWSKKTVKEANDLGASSYLTKPFTTTEVVDTINQVIKSAPRATGSEPQTTAPA